MRFIILFAAFLLTSSTFSQRIEEDLYLKHTLRQDGLSYNFKVLDPDKKGVSKYSKKKFYYWFKTQKVLSTQGGASGALLHGVMEAFYENKQLSQKGEFNKGLKTGEWLYWRIDGTLIRTEEWKNGKLDGTETLYDKTGKPIETIEHKKNTFSRKIADSLIVSNYERTKQTVYTYDSLDHVKTSAYYKNGLQEGKAKYYEQGKLVKTEKYSKGKLVVKAEKQKDPEGKTKKSWFRKKEKDASATEQPEQAKKKWFAKKSDKTAEPKKEKASRNPKSKTSNKFRDFFKKKKKSSAQK